MSALLCSFVEVKMLMHVVVDETVSSCEDYVSYYRGSSLGWPPVILSAPHGGRLRPSVIPDRDAGCWLSAEDRCEYSHTCTSKDYAR